MERVEDAKDLHEKIHEDGNWTDIRVDGVDTGARLKTNYTWEDSDGDLSCYAMKRSLKVHFAIEMGRIAAELERVDILHCDIKPCNFLVSKCRPSLSLHASNPIIDLVYPSHPSINPCQPLCTFPPSHRFDGKILSPLKRTRLFVPHDPHAFSTRPNFLFAPCHQLVAGR
jgi:hypothetical protein